MALSILATQVDGATIEAATWNSEFNNIYNNPITLISPVTADITWNDNAKATFGTDGDADIFYNATDLIINPNVAGTGGVRIIGGVSTPKLTMGDGAAEDTIVVFDGNAIDYHIGLDDSADTFIIGIGSTLGTTEQLSFAAAGAVFNEDSQNYDFRMEGNNNPNLFIMDAGDDNLGLGSAIQSATFLSLIAGAQARTHTSTIGYGLYFNADTYTDSGNGALAHHHLITIGRPTISTTQANTGTTTVYIENAPDVTGGGGIDNPYALHVDAGDVRLDGDLLLNGTPELFINETTNANMTIGMTILQATDDQILCFKDSGVSHGMTTLPLEAFLDVEVDDFFAVSKNDATGGVNFVCVNDVLNAIGFRLEAMVGAPDATSTTGTAGIIALVASEHDGANALTAPTAEACLLSIAHNSTSGNLTRWLVDEDGDIHQTTDAHNTLDALPDAEICRNLDLNKSVSGIIQSKWDEFINKDKQVLVDAGLFKSTSDDELMNMSQLARLHNGAIWQIYTQHKELEQRLLALEGPHEQEDPT